MNEKVQSTLKSSETDDWLDIKVVRPFAYLWALLCARLDIHPNTVTIVSMIIGAASSWFFAQGSFHYGGTHGLWLNVIGIILLMWADVLDCTDGQLARMTGKKSRLGRILDGLAGFVWFTPIYVGMVIRFYHHHSIEFGWLGIEDTQRNAMIATLLLLAFALYTGFVCFSWQARTADYYIQAHLFFLKGEKGSELDSSVKQQQIYDDTPVEVNRMWRFFLKSYIGYTRKQEQWTPKFQALMARLREKYHAEGNIPEELREDFHRYSLPVIKLNGLLTFNFRSAFLFLFCLADVPSLNFIFEGFFMSALCLYIIHRHERFCGILTDKLQTMP